MTDQYFEQRTAKRISGTSHRRWLREMLLKQFHKQPKNVLAGQLAGLIDHLEQERIRDPLTGAFNRGFIGALLTEELHHHHRPVGVLLMDLDHFKSINDQEPDGHIAGDRALKTFVQLVHQIVGERGTLGRWGGEEWLLVVPGTTQKKLYRLAVAINRRMAKVLAKQADLIRPKVTVSIGAYIIPHGQTTTQALAEVDKLVYQAKKQGRDQVVNS